MTDKMPRTIWARVYEAGTGHGEWDDYQPFDPSFAQKYTNTEQLIAELEGMKVHEGGKGFNAQQAHNAAIDAVIEKVRGYDQQND
jgi:hypothetical protein